MKKLIIILTAIISGFVCFAQQIPISENYFINKYALAASYAGHHNPKYLFAGYRSDWSGIAGGPKTLRLSYNDSFMPNGGYGGKIIYDKAGIFRQLYIMGSYSYNLKVYDDHHVILGLSAGFYKNRLNLLDYYNDPNYNVDPSLIQQDVKSKLKFMSDFSALWIWKDLEAGFMFSNISFGNANYKKEVELKYNPLVNFQFHTIYHYNLTEDWDIVPMAILRGGKFVKSQLEIASQVIYLKKMWGSIVFRDPGVWGIGAGINIDKGLMVAYNFNFASNVTLGVFNNHEFSVGINLFEYIKKSE